MFTPKKQQYEICLLKSNLEAIEEKLIVQNTVALPALQAENEQKFREVIRARDSVRKFHDERVWLNQENVKLTTQRMQLELQYETISKSFAHQEDDQLLESKRQKEIEMEELVCKYKDMLQEKSELFRKTHRNYSEMEINSDTENINNLSDERNSKLNKKQSAVDGLRAEMDEIRREVPKNLRDQVVKLGLERILKSLTEKLQDLEEKLKALTN